MTGEVLTHRDMELVLLPLMRAAMNAVHQAQLTAPGEIEVKPGDQSLVTPDDRSTEVLIREGLAQNGFRVYGEELGEFAGPEANPRYLGIVDPIDGTRPFANRDMGGSTIIVDIYDVIELRIVASAIGRPGTGELWFTSGGKTDLYRLNGRNRFMQVRRCKVWTFDPAISRPTVYVDNPNPFTRRGVDMLRADDLSRLDTSIRNAGLTKFAIGSNGLHHALVANGGPVAGAITTSIGGIQDLGGIATVEEAGGVTAAFRLTDDRKLQPCDPHRDLLMRGGYDFLVVAVDEARLEQLVGFLRFSLQE